MTFQCRHDRDMTSDVKETLKPKINKPIISIQLYTQALIKEDTLVSCYDLVCACCDLDTASQVRVAAAESLPFLLDCAKIRGPEYLTQMWQFIYPELIKATETEPESDIKSALMHALAQVSCL